MRILSCVLLVSFAIASAVNVVSAEPAFGVKNSTSNEQNRMRDSNNDNAPTLDCTRSKSDPRCTPQRPYYPPQHPHYPPPYRRPVIINQLPEEPKVDTHSLNDDWDGCRTAKLGAIRARRSGHADEANDLDDWLWKNCRAYSYELRQLEQDDM